MFIAFMCNRNSIWLSASDFSQPGYKKEKKILICSAYLFIFNKNHTEVHNKNTEVKKQL